LMIAKIEWADGARSPAISYAAVRTQQPTRDASSSAVLTGQSALQTLPKAGLHKCASPCTIVRSIFRASSTRACNTPDMKRPQHNATNKLNCRNVPNGTHRHAHADLHGCPADNFVDLESAAMTTKNISNCKKVLCRSAYLILHAPQLCHARACSPYRPQENHGKNFALPASCAGSVDYCLGDLKEPPIIPRNTASECCRTNPLHFRTVGRQLFSLPLRDGAL